MALRKFILKIILLGTLLGNAAAADAQYNKDYFYWASRRCLMNREYQEAIRVLNILLRADPDAAELQGNDGQPYHKSSVLHLSCGPAEQTVLSE